MCFLQLYQTLYDWFGGVLWSRTWFSWCDQRSAMPDFLDLYILAWKCLWIPSWFRNRHRHMAASKWFHFDETKKINDTNSTVQLKSQNSAANNAILGLTVKFFWDLCIFKIRGENTEANFLCLWELVYKTPFVLIPNSLGRRMDSKLISREIISCFLPFALICGDFGNSLSHTSSWLLDWLGPSKHQAWY